MVQNDQEAQNADLGTTVKNPPKVEVDAFSVHLRLLTSTITVRLFSQTRQVAGSRTYWPILTISELHQHGHKVAHNPGTLSHGEDSG